MIFSFFFSIQIEDGNLVYRFNCGSGEGQVLVPVDLSDGQWHRIVVERSGRHAEINLDDAYTAMGQAPGVHDSLNLYEEEVFFGARVDIHRNGYRDITKGFEGCMEDIRYHGLYSLLCLFLLFWYGLIQALECYYFLLPLFLVNFRTTLLKVLYKYKKYFVYLRLDCFFFLRS